MATLRTEPRTLSVPGVGDETRDVRVDALTNVTVAGTHRRRGLMSGMLGWRASGQLGLIPPHGRVEVWDLASATDVAYQDLWCCLSGIDGIDEIRVSNRPVDEPVRWLLGDARALGALTILRSTP